MHRPILILLICGLVGAWPTAGQIPTGYEIVQVTSNSYYEAKPRMNNHGQIVGSASHPEVAHAFLWEDGAMLDLNDLLPEGHGWTLLHATAINDDGYITGYGSNPDGVVQTSFLLTPIPLGDLNGDGCVDQADLGILLADWGCMSDCVGDLDSDGDTDQADLGILLAHWGEGCP